MNLLAIDCSASLCAACVYDTTTNTERSRQILDLGKGHAEHLIAVIGEALKSAGITYADLGAIAVSVGPGSFTGIRVAVSAARGFALALAIPVVGVNTLEAIAAETRATLSDRPVLAALTSGTDHIQAAVYDALGQQVHAPAMMTLGEAIDLAKDSGATLAGSAADRIATALPRAPQIGLRNATADISTYARLAIAKGFDGGKPSPLYLREPDAKPQAGFVLERRGGP